MYLRGATKAIYRSGKTSKYANLGYRLAKIERNVRNNRPELKDIQINGAVTVAAVNLSFNDLTGMLSQGTSETERLGNHVKIKKIKYSFHSTNVGADILLVQSQHGNTPVSTDFLAQRMTEVVQTSTDDHRIIKRFRNYSSSYQYITGIKSYKSGLPVIWYDSGATAVAKNRLTLVVSNMTGSSVLVEYAMTIYFTDS